VLEDLVSLLLDLNLNLTDVRVLALRDKALTLLEQVLDVNDKVRDLIDLVLEDTQLSGEGLVLTRSELLQGHIHFLKALLFIDQVIFLILAQLEIIDVVNEVLKGVSGLSESDFDLFKSIVNVFSLLVG
jgi:hypothetical protein